MIQGWLRSDGRKGIRNVVAVAYLVECAHHVARRIVDKADDPDVQLIGFPGCYPNAYAAKVMEAIATHPNVGGLVIVSLGCESFNREKLRAVVEASGRPAELLVIQEKGGTAATIAAGLEAVDRGIIGHRHEANRIIWIRTCLRLPCVRKTVSRSTWMFRRSFTFQRLKHRK